MNKCSIQLQRTPIPQSSKIAELYSSNDSTSTNTITSSSSISNGSSSSSFSSSDNVPCRNCNCNGKGYAPAMACTDTRLVEISAERRAHIERRVRVAYEFFDQVLALYTTLQLVLCFNGGKDCTVLLDLLMRYCAERNVSSKVPMLYIESSDSFKEIDNFVVHCVRHYNVKIIKYKYPLKEALTLMTQELPLIQGVFMGSRSTDPHCENLLPMQKTDSDWPSLMRLNPLLGWSYHDIWHYIIMYNVPYCRLYAEGYTSIGYKSNTLPNPHLHISCCNVSSTCASAPAAPAPAAPAAAAPAAAAAGAAPTATGAGAGCFRPAWELADPTKERAGRLIRK